MEKRHDIKYEENTPSFMWRKEYGEMLSRMRRIHGNHVENNIWDHDVNHEDHET